MIYYIGNYKNTDDQNKSSQMLPVRDMSHDMRPII